MHNILIYMDVKFRCRNYKFIIGFKFPLSYKKSPEDYFRAFINQVFYFQILLKKFIFFI